MGSGLGGLAAAIALRQRNFDVTVFEQAGELGEFGAGINVSPNSVKVFRALGLAEKLHAIGFQVEGLTWRDWGDGRLQHRVPLDRAEARYGAPYYVIHRSDLHRMLADAVPADAIRLGMRCTEVENGKDAAGLRFADGTHYEADLVIGSDGIRSVVRSSVFGGEGPRYAGTMCWRALVPAAALPPDRQDNCVTQWNGKGGFIVSYYVRHGQFVNIVAVRPQAGWTEESWSIPSSNDEMVAGFPGIGDTLRHTLRQATSCSKWGQFSGEHAAQWTRGRVALLGDAAHAMLATFGQGANMAFEDSYVLARWLDEHRDDPAAALAGYEAVRKPRASRVQRMSRMEVRFKKLGSPWERLRREFAYVTRFGSHTGGIYRWIFGYDPVKAWRGS